MTKSTIEQLQEKLGFDMQVDFQLAIQDVMAKHVATATKADYSVGDVSYCLGASSASAIFEAMRTDHGVIRVLTDEEKEVIKECLKAFHSGALAQLDAIGDSAENIQNPG